MKKQSHKIQQKLQMQLFFESRFFLALAIISLACAATSILQSPFVGGIRLLPAIGLCMLYRLKKAEGTILIRTFSVIMIVMGFLLCFLLFSFLALLIYAFSRITQSFQHMYPLYLMILFLSLLLIPFLVYYVTRSGCCKRFRQYQQKGSSLGDGRIWRRLSACSFFILISGILLSLFFLFFPIEYIAQWLTDHFQQLSHDVNPVADSSAVILSVPPKESSLFSRVLFAISMLLSDTDWCMKWLASRRFSRLITVK